MSPPTQTSPSGLELSPTICIEYADWWAESTWFSLWRIHREAGKLFLHFLVDLSHESISTSLHPIAKGLSWVPVSWTSEAGVSARPLLNRMWELVSHHKLKFLRAGAECFRGQGIGGRSWWQKPQWQPRLRQPFLHVKVEVLFLLSLQPAMSYPRWLTLWGKMSHKVCYWHPWALPRLCVFVYFFVVGWPEYTGRKLLWASHCGLGSNATQSTC